MDISCPRRHGSRLERMGCVHGPSAPHLARSFGRYVAAGRQPIFCAQRGRLRQLGRVLETLTIGLKRLLMA